MRYYTEISKEDFLAKVKVLMQENEDDDGFPWEMPVIIGRDLSKVSFDWENYSDFNQTEGFADYPIGHREIAPNFHIFFAQAGGDWEFPICYIFYYGDDRLRAYIPKDGNAWNKKDKCAYGSEDEEESVENEMSSDKEHSKEISEEKMITEILNHIIKNN